MKEPYKYTKIFIVNVYYICMKIPSIAENVIKVYIFTTLIKT